MKRPRKIALVNVFDCPREDYSAYWQIGVTGDDAEGYRWQARIMSYAPIGFDWQGKIHPSWPDGVATPVYPSDAHLARDAQYKRMTPAEQVEEKKRQEAFRAECSRIAEASPKPVYVIDEAIDACKTRDEADTAAQEWVKARIGKYRKPNLPALTEAEIKQQVAEFDAARARKDVGSCDRIRGRLRSRGVQLMPPEKAADPKPTKFRQSGHALALGPAGMLGESVAEAVRRLFRPVLMALGYATALRNTRMVDVQAAIDAGAGAGLLRIYTATRPATCGAATTLLAELTHTDPCAGAPSSGVLTFNAITQDSSANATGTAAWYRDVDSTGTCVVDGSVGTSGSDLNLNSTSIATGQAVSVSSKAYTEGNP